MDEKVKLVKAEGTPNLIKFDFLGMTVLVDHEERTVIPLSEPVHSLDAVIKYMRNEGFLVPVKDSKSSGNPENN